MIYVVGKLNRKPSDFRQFAEEYDISICNFLQITRERDVCLVKDAVPML
jgi:hypothetical protein